MLPSRKFSAETNIDEVMCKKEEMITINSNRIINGESNSLARITVCGLVSLHQINPMREGIQEVPDSVV